jgi:hypothetical protein
MPNPSGPTGYDGTQAICTPACSACLIDCSTFCAIGGKIATPTGNVVVIYLKSFSLFIQLFQNEIVESPYMVLNRREDSTILNTPLSTSPATSSHISPNSGGSLTDGTRVGIMPIGRHPFWSVTDDIESLLEKALGRLQISLLARASSQPDSHPDRWHDTGSTTFHGR